MGGRTTVIGVAVFCMAACAPQAPIETFDGPTGSPSGSISTTGLDATPPLGVPTGEGDISIDDPGAGDTVLIESSSGLIERLPNTCKLENYQQFQGQNATVLISSAIDRPYRIVGPDTIVSQEYDPSRLNFQTTGGGQIRNITCG